jgi:hypothetical protein
LLVTFAEEPLSALKPQVGTPPLRATLLSKLQHVASAREPEVQCTS